jgi:hypothetical protein
MADAIRQIGVSEVTYYRWRQEFGGLKIEQVKRIRGNKSCVLRSMAHPVAESTRKRETAAAIAASLRSVNPLEGRTQLRLVEVAPNLPTNVRQCFRAGRGLKAVRENAWRSPGSRGKCSFGGYRGLGMACRAET